MRLLDEPMAAAHPLVQIGNARDAANQSFEETRV